MRIFKPRAKSLQEVLPIAGISDGFLFFKDGRVAIGFRVFSLEMESMSGSEIDGLSAHLLQLLSILPPNAVLQKIDAYDHRPKKEESGRLSLAGYFEKKQLSHLYHKQALFHSSYLFLSLGKEGQPAANPVSSLFAMGRPLFSSPYAGLEKRMEKLEGLGRRLESSLKGAGIGTKKMEETDLQKVLHRYFNLCFEGEANSYHRSFQKHKNGAVLGEKEIRLVSMTGQGAYAENSRKIRGVGAAFAAPLSHELDFPHLVSLSFKIEKRESKLKSLDRERKLNSALDIFSTQDHEIKETELDAFTAEVRMGNEQLVSMNLSVIVWQERALPLQRRVEEVIGAFGKMAGARCLVESIDTANLFTALSPGNSFQCYRWLLLSGPNAMCYFHLFGPYSSEKEGIYLADRFENPLRVRLFNTDLSNQNAIVIGPSGSGKSFSVGSLMVQRHERADRQIIIDNGGSYKNAITALGGKYIEYDPEHPISVNPFFARKKEDGSFRISGDKLSFLTGLIAVIWKGRLGEGLSQAERSVLSLLIPSFYDEFGEFDGEIPRLCSFYDWLKCYRKKIEGDKEAKKLLQSFDLDQLLITLRPFVEGEYRELLNSNDRIELSSHRLICFDMARVKANQMLYPIISLIITELALEQVRGFEDERKFIYMDEAWSMLSDSMGDFVEHMYRTVRKNNGSMCIITQGIEEILSSSIGPAIIANAATQIILRHNDPAQIDRIVEALGFTDHEADKIRSLRMSHSWRELFIKQGDYAKVYLMEVSPHLAAVLSSKPEERNALKKLIDTKNGIEPALDQFIENKEKARYHGTYA